MVLKETGDSGVAFANAIASRKIIVLRIWRRGYILEELGVTTSLLDTLQLSIGLSMPVSRSSRLTRNQSSGEPFRNQLQLPISTTIATYHLLDVAVHGVVNDRDLGSHLE